MRRLLILTLVLLLLSACAAPEETEEAPPVQAPPETPAPEEESLSEEPPEEEAPSEDYVLLTLDAPLSDGRTLRLEAVGKKVDDYSYGVREVRVWDGEALLQAVQAREGVESENVFDSDYTECWAPEETMEALDLNFDGNTDFGLFGWRCNNMIPYYYWTWDPEAGEYQYAFTLQGASADPEAKELQASFRLSATEYETDYYRPDGTGTLYLDRVRIERWEAGGLANQENWVPRPEQRFAPGTPDWSYHDLTLTSREEYANEDQP